SHLSPVPRLLITTEGRRCIEHIERIDPNNSRFDLLREAVRTRDVSGPNSRGETVNRVVCLLEQIVFVFETDHRHNRTKNLFLGDAHTILHFRKDRGTEEVTFLKVGRELWRLATGDHRRTFLASDIDVALDAIQLLFRNLWSHLS